MVQPLLFYSMRHIQLSIQLTDSVLRDILLARLSDIGYEGFEEMETGLSAYITEANFEEQIVAGILSEYALSYSVNTIEEQNWNAQWEESFQPVIVPDFCTVRAHFHDMVVTTPYEVVITPQMSFGTGHHATTMLMMMQMQHLEFADKTVLDFGTGTGILAILAEKLGAGNIIAIDNDEWSYRNALENIERNLCKRVAVSQGSLEDVDGCFDVVLANINRNILLSYMGSLSAHLNSGGYILMSGLLKEDKGIIVAAANSTGLNFLHMDEMNNWIVLLFQK